MKIIQIVPGFGGTFYCGNCLRDSGLVQTLRTHGQDAMTVPVYLPLHRNDTPLSGKAPLFYGAVNIYLKQQYPWLRTMPEWMERILNSRPILRFAAQKAGSTRAKGLEEMTVSMLLGREGNQHKELEELTGFLRRENPDIVHLSNALLLGMARTIREEVKVPVVCTLQDEDVWVDALDNPFRKQVWALMAEKSRDAHAFLAVSRYYARIMQARMNLPGEKIHVVPVAVNPENYTPFPPASDPQAIGFLSRMNEGNGFGVLIDAFMELKSDPRFRRLRLYATGGMTGDDRPFFRAQMRKLKKKNLLDHVEIQHGFRQDNLKDFFRHITLLTVPVLKGEAFGLYQLEALASGVPLVQPDVGAFPEIIEATHGGVLYRPNTAPALTEKLAEMLTSPGRLEQMSQTGVKAVLTHFDCRKLTPEIIRLYQQIVESK